MSCDYRHGIAKGAVGPIARPTAPCTERTAFPWYGPPANVPQPRRGHARAGGPDHAVGHRLWGAYRPASAALPPRRIDAQDVNSCPFLPLGARRASRIARVLKGLGGCQSPSSHWIFFGLFVTRVHIRVPERRGEPAHLGFAATRHPVRVVLLERRVRDARLHLHPFDAARRLRRVRDSALFRKCGEGSRRCRGTCPPSSCGRSRRCATEVRPAASDRATGLRSASRTGL